MLQFLQAHTRACYRWSYQAALHMMCSHYCPICHTRLYDFDRYLCDQCYESLGKLLTNHSYCCVCGQSVGPFLLVRQRCHRCQNRHPAIEPLIRVGEYQEPLKDLIRLYKFYGHQYLCRFLGDLLAQVIAARLSPDDVDILMPIPLHWLRYVMRRYNQAELLAQQARQHLKKMGYRVKVAQHLVRVRYTTPQTTLFKTQRHTNLRNAFAIIDDKKLRGKRVCLIDDVSTSGTTLHTAARLLRQAGAQSVSAAVLAVGHQPHILQIKG